ncbi:MAG: lipopolysaccharide transport periplasmic protein LptA [Curvibacter sp.]|nr:MAG: lipopolysaccharide transport periplasmic protein LptA [Curvibacter sp.]
MKNTFLSVSLWLLVASVAGHAWAEKADRNKPMNVEADALRYDDLKQVSVFTGNVVLTKGSIIIRGAQLEVRQDPDGYQFGVVTGSESTLAFFRQKRDGLDEFIEGDGVTIEYDGRADTVRFIKKAKLRRFRGATLADEVTGASILYENLSDKFTVDGTPKSATAPAGRVRAMLTPKPDATLPVNGQPTPTLRTTPQLEKAAP